MQVPAPFSYERASSVEEALALLAELGDSARILAGGHSLLPMMKLRLAAPEYVIDIDALAGELGYIRVSDPPNPIIQIGAMTRHRQLLESAELAARAPIFTDAEQVIADPVVRNRGTIGGALCQADPSEDLSAVCAAVDAELVVRSLGGERLLTMADFYRGPYRTALGDDELLVEIRLPARDCAGSAYEKVSRRVGDWAVAASGVALGDELTSLPAREVLEGREPSPELFARAGRAAAQACAPVTDQRGSAEYKHHVAGVLVTRALTRAAQRAAVTAAQAGA
jgi:carbon-monoxide dehydrogenase medium subunit